jgi:hypothetical protein
MRYYGFGVLVMTLATIPLGAQTPGDSSEPMLIDPDTTAPRLTHKTDPT